MQSNEEGTQRRDGISANPSHRRWEDIRSEIDFVMKNGCSSAGVLAGIGEGYLMSHQDWTIVAKTAIDHMNMNEFTYRAPVPNGSTNVFW
ncbi:MAG: hypothetical protein ABSA50_05690 [Candidatus Bathyarchaeia archaeon]